MVWYRSVSYSVLLSLILSHPIQSCLILSYPVFNHILFLCRFKLNIILYNIYFAFVILLPYMPLYIVLYCVSYVHNITIVMFIPLLMWYVHPCDPLV